MKRLSFFLIGWFFILCAGCAAGDLGSGLATDIERVIELVGEEDGASFQGADKKKLAEVIAARLAAEGPYGYTKAARIVIEADYGRETTFFALVEAGYEIVQPLRPQWDTLRYIIAVEEGEYRLKKIEDAMDMPSQALPPEVLKKALGILRRYGMEPESGIYNWRVSPEGETVVVIVVGYDDTPEPFPVWANVYLDRGLVSTHCKTTNNTGPDGTWAKVPAE